MKIWKILIFVIALMSVIPSWGCNMTESNFFQPKPTESMKEIQASENSEKLDADVIAFSQGQFSIESARYYHAPAKTPWLAVSKSIQNQMAEESFHQKIYEWHEPGIDIIDVYPQGNTAFAVAMPKDRDRSADKLIGFYVLKLK